MLKAARMSALFSKRSCQHKKWIRISNFHLDSETSVVSYQSIVVLTGAGISAESGISTFRDNGGLWENHRLEDVCTPQAFVANPDLVHRFYNARRAQLLDQPQPNSAHLALADFEQRFCEPGNAHRRFTLVTQNVDNLHERAGSKNVLHMHGELLKVSCTDCQSCLPWHDETQITSICPNCSATSTLRPHIVWFGEMPLFMAEIEEALNQCDLFVAIGTSGTVYPAAGFVAHANANGAHTVEINLEASLGQSQFAEHHYGLASATVERFFARLV